MNWFLFFMAVPAVFVLLCAIGFAHALWKLEQGDRHE